MLVKWLNPPREEKRWQLEFVRLTFSKIAQKVTNRFYWLLQEMLLMGDVRDGSILVLSQSPWGTLTVVLPRMKCQKALIIKHLTVSEVGKIRPGHHMWAYKQFHSAHRAFTIGQIKRIVSERFRPSTTWATRSLRSKTQSGHFGKIITRPGLCNVTCYYYWQDRCWKVNFL